MKRIISIAAALVAIISCGTGCCQKGANDNYCHLERALGSVDTTEFGKLFNDVSLTGSTAEAHEVIVIKDDKVVYERYDMGHRPDVKHALWSASKTFTATAIGFAVQEGLLSVQDPVTKFFSQDELPAQPSDTLGRVTVWNLLTMTSGFKRDRIAETEGLRELNPTKSTLAEPFIFEPGTQFKYNSMNTYLLSAIITKLTGQKVVDYLKPRLFDPLGITDYWWKDSAEGISMGGWGLFLRPEDLGKMGLLFLHKGNWNGTQLLPESWFDEAMSAQILQTAGKGYSEEEAARLYAEDDWNAGYGYQMWRCKTGAYRLDGAWGQFSIICPDKNAVIVYNGLSTNTHAVLDNIWRDVYNNL